jgi:hypothetical protein
MAATIGLPELLRRSETIIIAAEIVEEPSQGESAPKRQSCCDHGKVASDLYR